MWNMQNCFLLGQKKKPKKHGEKAQWSSIQANNDGVNMTCGLLSHLYGV